MRFPKTDFKIMIGQVTEMIYSAKAEDASYCLLELFFLLVAFFGRPNADSQF